MTRRIVSILIVIMGTATVICSSGVDFPIMPLSEVEPGMHGYGLTVFQGDRIESFDLEVIEVMERDSLYGGKILVRCSGERVTQTGVFAGMSGSPVYFEGKLAGALAFAFPYATEPIAGVTPIEEMLKLREQHPTHQPPGLRPSARRAAVTSVQTKLEAARGIGTFATAATTLLAITGLPLQASTVLPEQWLPHTVGYADSRAPNLEGLVAQTAPLTPLQPGSSIGVQMTGGDLVISAVGTLTAIVDNYILAFGHEFMDFGACELPLTTTKVYTVIPNLQTSFKLAAPVATIGTTIYDSSVGILARTDLMPRTIELAITVTASPEQPQRHSIWLVNDNRLLPQLTIVSLGHVIAKYARQLGDISAEALGSIKLKDLPPVQYRRSVVEQQSAYMAAMVLLEPVYTILAEANRNPEFERLEFELSVASQLEFGVLRRMELDRQMLESGRTSRVTFELDRYGVGVDTVRTEIFIPEKSYRNPLRVVVMGTPEWRAWKLARVKGGAGGDDLSTILTAITATDSPDGIHVVVIEKYDDLLINRAIFPNTPVRFKRLQSMIPAMGIGGLERETIQQEQFIQVPYRVTGTLEFTVPVAPKS